MFNMNDLFHFKRFARLFRKVILERPVQLAGLVLLVFLITIILYAILRFINLPWDVIQNTTFIFGFVGGGCFLASLVFNFFATNAAGTSFLTLPASSFEKWLCGFLLVGVIYPAVYLAFYRIT